MIPGVVISTRSRVHSCKKSLFSVKTRPSRPRLRGVPGVRAHGVRPGVPVRSVRAAPAAGVDALARGHGPACDGARLALGAAPVARERAGEGGPLTLLALPLRELLRHGSVHGDGQHPVARLLSSSLVHGVRRRQEQTRGFRNVRVGEVVVVQVLQRLPGTRARRGGHSVEARVRGVVDGIGDVQVSVQEHERRVGVAGGAARDARAEKHRVRGETRRQTKQTRRRLCGDETQPVDVLLFGIGRRKRDARKTRGFPQVPERAQRVRVHVGGGAHGVHQLSEVRLGVHDRGERVVFGVFERVFVLQRKRQRQTRNLLVNAEVRGVHRRALRKRRERRRAGRAVAGATGVRGATKRARLRRRRVVHTGGGGNRRFGNRDGSGGAGAADVWHVPLSRLRRRHAVHGQEIVRGGGVPELPDPVRRLGHHRPGFPRDALAGELHGGAPRPRHLRLLLGGGRRAERFAVDFEVRVHRRGVVSRGFQVRRLLE
mmetsp:Transcript_12914/g.54160  ORF Transcript_12914/g.54160 Transcript_12914/m.54160 type:complete len:486 (+) Transcript_12914:193-1650(+)